MVSSLQLELAVGDTLALIVTAPKRPKSTKGAGDAAAQFIAPFTAVAAPAAMHNDTG